MMLLAGPVANEAEARAMLSANLEEGRA